MADTSVPPPLGEKRPVLRSPSGSRERPHSVPTLDLDRCLQTLRQARSDSEQFAALLLVGNLLTNLLTNTPTANSSQHCCCKQFAALLLVGGHSGLATHCPYSLKKYMGLKLMYMF
ncbi:hypothetical protein Bbelb_328050 [Branchiostoma belcheri]|nr:hypothetical protein Bbelb_328050 [Branchiostoma belcheri]